MQAFSEDIKAYVTKQLAQFFKSYSTGFEHKLRSLMKERLADFSFQLQAPSSNYANDSKLE